MRELRRAGERGYAELSARYGAATLRDYTDELLDYSERLARAEIAALPDGVYRFTDYIDADNIEDGPVVIAVAVEIAGDRIIVDFAGTSPQVKAGINSPLAFTRSAVCGAIRFILDPAIPNSAVRCISPVRTWISSGLPSGPMTVVCSERYMLNLGMAT